METNIGLVIKEYRKRRGISQEALCGTACDVSTLSRIERGKIIPSRHLAESFFEKLGIHAPISNLPMDSEQIERYNLEYEITNKISNGDFEIRSELIKYKNCASSMDIFEKQFYTYNATLYLQEHGLKNRPKLLLKKFCESLRLTFKDFTTEADFLSGHFFTKIELMILNNIARTEYNCGQKQAALNLMYFLKSYFNSNYIDDYEKAHKYDVILFNLTNWEGLNGNYEKALSLSREGIAFSSKYGKLHYFPLHIFNEGYSMLKMGLKEEGLESIELSLLIMKKQEKTNIINIALKELKKEFGINFSKFA